MPTSTPLRSVACLALLIACSVPALAAKKAPPALAASAYLAHDTHDSEHVTIGAEPLDARAKGDFFRVDYYGHNMMPVRVVIQNDSDHPLDLKDVRIQFIAADGTKVPAATPDELNRRLFRFNDIKARRIPGTPITYHKTPVDKKILEDDKDFGFTQTVVPAHATASGFLFYDMTDLPEQPLRGGELYVKMIHVQDGKNTELFAFTLPFDKYLAAKPTSAPATENSKDKP